MAKKDSGILAQAVKEMEEETGQTLTTENLNKIPITEPEQSDKARKISDYSTDELIQILSKRRGVTVETYSMGYEIIKRLHITGNQVVLVWDKN